MAIPDSNIPINVILVVDVYTHFNMVSISVIIIFRMFAISRSKYPQKASNTGY